MPFCIFVQACGRYSDLLRLPVLRGTLQPGLPHPAQQELDEGAEESQDSSVHPTQPRGHAG